MPFKPKLFSEMPGGTPDVLIVFHGQLLLRSENGTDCEVGVNPIASSHNLSIEARMKRRNATDRIRMRHLGPLHFRPSEGMSISVAGNMAQPSAFKLVTLEPIDYEHGTGREDDFRWILNLEGGLFHGEELHPAVFPSQNVIRLQEGEYYFRTAARSEPRYQYRRMNGNKPEFVFRTIGGIASASVFLQENQAVVLRWQDGTRERDRTLTLSKMADTFYEIYIENTPLFLDEPRQADLPNMDELAEYYKVIPQIPAGNRRFKLVPELYPGEGDRGSPDIPCQVMTLDGPLG
jgi:hypothetical protein